MVLEGIEQGSVSQPSDFYSKMLCLPLFMGMSKDDLQHALAKAKMEFGRYAQGEKLVRSGQSCGCLLIVTHGDVECETPQTGCGYSVVETLHGPTIIQPECVFGRFQTFTRTVTAASAKVNTMMIAKADILQLAAASFVFRLNLVNYLSTSLQKCGFALWQQAPQTMERRIVNFLVPRCITPSGHKVFKIKMQTLADLLNTNRVEISHALDAMQDLGLVVKHRGRIEVPAMQDLVNADL